MIQKTICELYRIKGMVEGLLWAVKDEYAIDGLDVVIAEIDILIDKVRMDGERIEADNEGDPVQGQEEK